MPASYLWSTALMGLFLVAVLVFLRAADWKHYSPRSEEGGLAALAEDLAGSEAVWFLTFLGLVLVFGGGTLAYVGVLGFGSSATWGLVLAGVAVLTVGGYVLIGSYWSARSRGKPSSLALGEGAAVLGLLAIAAVAVKLFVA